MSWLVGKCHSCAMAISGNIKYQDRAKMTPPKSIAISPKFKSPYHYVKMAKKRNWFGDNTVEMPSLIDES